MPHPSEIISVPTILSSLALLLGGMISLAMLSLLPVFWDWPFALLGSGSAIGAIYFLQLEIRIYCLACKRYEEQ